MGLFAVSGRFALRLRVTSRGPEQEHLRAVHRALGTPEKTAAYEARIEEAGIETEFEGDAPDLVETIRNAKATVLLGLSGRPGAFNEEIVRAMADNHKWPIIPHYI